MDKKILRKDCVLVDRPHPRDETGYQIVYAFKNGYGASVVRFNWDYKSDMFARMGQAIGNAFGMNMHFGESIGYAKGLWEVATVRILDDDNWELVHTTLFGNAEVRGNLTEKQVNEILLKIENNEFEEVNEDMYNCQEDESFYQD